jgi:hypothetical protein
MRGEVASAPAITLAPRLYSWPVAVAPAIDPYGGALMRILAAVGIVALLTGCASTPPSAPAAGTQRFTGEVWTWDTQESTVTIMQDGGQAVRVKVSPDQMRTLRHHAYTTVVGVPAPPVGLEQTMKPAGPMNAVPRGQAEIAEVRGTVTTADASGRVALQSDRGPLHVWAAPGADQRFAKGTPVSVRMSVQPVDMVAATTTPAPPVPTPVGAAASPSSEPGDHAVVTGRIMGVNPGGVLVVESPTGPIQVLANDTARYKVGDWIQVRTTVRTTS